MLYKEDTKMVAGIKECVEALAQKRGISKVEAHSIMNDVVDVMTEKIKEGGVSFKGKFTIKTKVRKGRTGKCKFNGGKEWKTEDTTVLSIATGSELDNELNNR